MLCNQATICCCDDAICGDRVTLSVFCQVIVCSVRATARACEAANLVAGHEGVTRRGPRGVVVRRRRADAYGPKLAKRCAARARALLPLHFYKLMDDDEQAVAVSLAETASLAETHDDHDDVAADKAIEAAALAAARNVPGAESDDDGGDFVEKEYKAPDGKLLSKASVWMGCCLRAPRSTVCA